VFLVVFLETLFVVSHHFILVLQDAYKANMVKTQAKLLECVEKQSMQAASLEKLSTALATDSEPLASGMDEDIAKAAPEIDSRGENRVTDWKLNGKSSQGKKYSSRQAIHQKHTVTKQATPKHRYHCEF
jgi:hypothetical protein